MPGKLVIYRGLPGSGKTTLARRATIGEGFHVLAGRDHIRKELGIEGGVGTPGQENQVTQIQKGIIRQGLRNGAVVHVDDMNLKERYVKHLRFLVEYHNTEVEIVDLRDTPLEDCIARDLARKEAGGHYVGEARIRDLHRRYVRPLVPKAKVKGRKGMPETFKPAPYEASKLDLYGEPWPRAVIVDLDGTTALKCSERGYHDYDERVFNDSPNEPVIAVVRALIRDGWVPVYLSGRMDSCREATLRWITRHILYTPASELFMRATGDYRPDYEVKNELFEKHVRGNYRVELAIDDRNQVVDLWRAKGITCLQVQDGNF